MASYLMRRLISALVTLVFITIIVFLLVRSMPGDAAIIIAGPNSSPEDVEQIRSSLRLDQNILVQYGTYMANLVQGDFGVSSTTSQPVWNEISSRLPATLGLATASTALAAVAGIALGVTAALWRNSPVDYGVSAFSIGASAMPTFWLGLLLILLFAVSLQWLPPSGKEGLASWILPTITLGAFSVALIARVSRTAMMEAMTTDYIRTASAKGVSRLRIIVRHGLRNALLPIVTVIGIQFGSLMGGAVLTEVVFAWPGIGQLLVNSVFSRDYTVIQGIVLVYAVLVIALNFILDLLYSVLDPRIRY